MSKVKISTSTGQVELAKQADLELKTDETDFQSHLTGAVGFIHPTSDIDFPHDDGITDFNTLQEALNHIWSAGVVSGAVVTDDGTGTAVNVSVGEVVLRRSNEADGELVTQLTPSASSLEVADNSDSLIYVEYSGENITPAIKTTTNFATVEGNVRVVLALVSRHGITLNIITRGNYNTNHPYKNTARLVDLGMQHVPDGTIVGAVPASLNFTISAGAFYLGVSKIEHNSINTSIADTFTYWYEDLPDSWIPQPNQVSLTDAQYATGTGLATLGNGKFTTAWIWVALDDNGIKVHVLYGYTNAATQEDAEISERPPNLPDELDTLTAVLIGRAVVEEGTGVISVMASLFDTSITSANTTAHNFLAGLQGGQASEYYHLTGEQLVKVTNGVEVFHQDNEPSAFKVGDCWVKLA